MIKPCLSAAAAIVLTALIMIMGGTKCCAEEYAKPEFRVISRGNKITVIIDNMKEDTSYMASINGGKLFAPVMSGNSISFGSLRNGTYQVCVLEKGYKEILSDVESVSIGAAKKSTESIKVRVRGMPEKFYCDGGISITLSEFSLSDRYIYSWNDGVSWQKLESRETVIENIPEGMYNVCVKSADDPRKTSGIIRIYVPHQKPLGKGYVYAPMIKQFPELPTGCEITSLTMALHFYGFTIPKTFMADYFLDKAEYRTADYRKKFVGDPREIRAYGCFADVIVNSAERYFTTVPNRTFDVLNLTGCTPDTLYSFIDCGYPVIVWATGKMKESGTGPSWADRETGERITWVSNEHCLLLTGYDSNHGYVIVNDPMIGMTSYSKKIFEQRFAELESQAIVIIETTEKTE